MDNSPIKLLHGHVIISVTLGSIMVAAKETFLDYARYLTSFDQLTANSSCIYKDDQRFGTSYVTILIGSKTQSNIYYVLILSTYIELWSVNFVTNIIDISIVNSIKLYNYVSFSFFFLFGPSFGELRVLLSKIKTPMEYYMLYNIIYMRKPHVKFGLKKLIKTIWIEICIYLICLRLK